MAWKVKRADGLVCVRVFTFRVFMLSVPDGSGSLYY